MPHAPRTMPPPRLLDRTGELQVLDRLLANVRSGQSAVLVVRGEPGIGKTALLRHLVGQASGFHVVRAAGVESEMELAFAGLHRLCAPMLGRLGSLAEPQRRELSVAFGPEPLPHSQLLLRGLAVRLTDGYAAAAPMRLRFATGRLPVRPWPDAGLASLPTQRGLDLAPPRIARMRRRPGGGYCSGYDPDSPSAA